MYVKTINTYKTYINKDNQIRLASFDNKFFGFTRKSTNYLDN